MKAEVGPNYQLIDEKLSLMQEAISGAAKAGVERGKIIKTMDEIAIEAACHDREIGQDR